MKFFGILWSHIHYILLQRHNSRSTFAEFREERALLVVEIQPAGRNLWVADQMYPTRTFPTSLPTCTVLSSG